MVSVATITNAEDMAAAIEIRRLVFIDEQGVPVDEELDGKDDEAVHFLAKLEGRRIGTVRVRIISSDGHTYAKVERLAVLKDSRRTGAGRSIMLAVEDWAKNLPQHPTEIKLDAQVEAADFYRNLSYHEIGDVFLDVGIPHIKMYKELR